MSFGLGHGSPLRLGGLNVSGQLSGNVLSLGSVIGDVLFNGGLVDGRIAAQGSILGNLTTYGPTDSNSAIISGGSIGSTLCGMKLIAGNIYGIMAAVGPINVGSIGTTTSVGYCKQNDRHDQDAALIDGIFSQGVVPLSTADTFDRNALGDLLNLNQIRFNLSNLTVRNGKRFQHDNVGIDY